MPARNIVKTYVEDGIYHVYNRGVEKRPIFIDHQDYSVFLHILKTALLPAPENDPTFYRMPHLQGATLQDVSRQTKTYFDEIELLAYCLMPNHFHMILRQITERSMSQFFRSVSVRYAMYFNKKYHRVGQLFQSAYKAVMILDDDYLIHASRYVHTNARNLFERFEDAYSSYKEYLGLRTTTWVHPEFILDLFGVEKSILISKYASYKDFVEACDVESSHMLDIDSFED